jgi:caffeoyl-CoA O-methyltransferase
MRVPPTPTVIDYVMANGLEPDEVQERLVDRTKSELGDRAGMQIAPEQGSLITLLTRIVGARVAVEVGTFTGYSSLSILRGMADDGQLLCCDTSEEWTALARDAWQEAGVSDRVELKIGPALDTLRALDPDERIDFAFVDADKVSYWVYYEELIKRMRPGGLVLFDNVLYGGHVLEEDVTGNAAALKEFNPRLAADPRVEVVMLPIADGLTVARKL